MSRTHGLSARRKIYRGGENIVTESFGTVIYDVLKFCIIPFPGWIGVKMNKILAHFLALREDRLELGFSGRKAGWMDSGDQ